MRRFLVLVILAGAFSTPAPAWAAQSVSVSQLLEDAASYDEQEIILTGELIGDYGTRPDGTVWTQLNDDSYASRPLLEDGPLAGANQGVGIRGTIDQFENLDPPGRYTTRGPIVRAVGIWRYHDEIRNGESYLDVSMLEVVEPGRPMTEGPDPVVLLVGLGLLATASGMVIRAAARQRRA